MIEQALKLLNSKDYFYQYLPHIIEVFVEYYGEENRSSIEEKFNSMDIISFNKPEEKAHIINKTLNEIQEKYYRAFFTKYGLEYNRENITIYLPYHIQTSSSSLIEKYLEYRTRQARPTEEKRQEIINDFINEIRRRYGIKVTFEQVKSLRGTKQLEDFINQFPEYLTQYIKSCLNDDYVDIIEERQKKEIVELLAKIGSSITLDNFDESFANKDTNFLGKLDQMSDDFLEMKKLYAEEVKPLEPYINYCQKCKIIQKEIYEKALIDLILKEAHYFPGEEIIELKLQIAEGKGLNFNKMPTIICYFGANLTTIPLINAFSSANCKIVDGKEENWQKDSIIYDRIRFFKSLGIDKGSTYEDYLNDPLCQSLVPSPTFVDEILESRKKAIEQAKIKYYSSLPDYKMIREHLDSLSLANKDDGFGPNLYENTIMCICPNAIQTEEGLKLKPIAYFKMKISNIKETDAFIIHELNHIYELSLVADYPDYTEYKCGWDTSSQAKEQTTDTNLEARVVKREYELFNEIVNELISQDICHLLHEHGLYIFSPKEEAIISNKTSYECSMFIIREFYKLYIEDIKETRRTKDMTKLFAKVGEENFNALNNLFHKFYKHFSNMKIYQVLDDLKNGVITEKTKVYQEIEAERDEILSRMRTHTEEYLRTQGLKN